MRDSAQRSGDRGQTVESYGRQWLFLHACLYALLHCCAYLLDLDTTYTISASYIEPLLLQRLDRDTTVPQRIIDIRAVVGSCAFHPLLSVGTPPFNLCCHLYNPFPLLYLQSLIQLLCPSFCVDTYITSTTTLSLMSAR